MGRRRVATLLIATSLAFAALLSLRDSLQDRPDPSPSSSPSGDISRVHPAEVGWFALTTDFPSESSLAGFDLHIGSLVGRTRTIKVRYGPLQPSASFKGALPFGVGPVGDRVLYGYWAGDVSELHELSVRTGLDRKIWSTFEIIHHAVLGVSFADILALTVDINTRVPNAIWLIDETGQRPPKRVIDLTDRVVKPTEAVDARLVLSSDGLYLGVVNCPATCSVETYRTGDWSLAGRIDLPLAVIPGGATADAMWVVPSCGDVACETMSISFEDTHVSSRVQTCLAFALESGSSDLAVIVDGPPTRDCTAQSYVLRRTTQNAQGSQLLVSLPDRGRQLVMNGTAAGYQATPGWVLLGPDGGLLDFSASGSSVSTMLVNVRDGRRIEGAVLTP